MTPTKTCLSVYRLHHVFTLILFFLLFFLPSAPLSTLHPGREHRNTSPSHLRHPKEQGLAAVDPTGQKRRSAKQRKGRSRSSTGHVREKRTGRRHGVSEGGGLSDLQSPNSEVGEEGSQEAKRKQRSRSRSRRSRRRNQQTQSLPRDSFWNNDESETEEETVRGRKKEKESQRRLRKSRSVGSVRRRESEEEEEQDKEEEKEWSQDDVFLSVPSPAQKLPRPKYEEDEDWEVEEKDWEVAAGYGQMRREEVQLESWENDWAENGETQVTKVGVQRPLPVIATIDPESQKKPFSFLAATSMEQLQDDESDSGGSQSDVSMSAASISGLSLASSMQADGSRARVLPGPWLRPSWQKVAKVTEEGRPTRGEGAAALS